MKYYITMETRLYIDAEDKYEAEILAISSIKEDNNIEIGGMDIVCITEEEYRKKNV